MTQSVSFAYCTDTHGIRSAGLLPDVDVDVEHGGRVVDFRDQSSGRLSESASSDDTCPSAVLVLTLPLTSSKSHDPASMPEFCLANAARARLL
jgi:hypothetical protein